MNKNEGTIKIDIDYLENINNNDLYKYFGNWINNISELKEQFINAEPFENIVIDDFLETSYAEKLYEIYPNFNSDWYVFENPIEVKYVYDDINNLPTELKNYFYYLSTPQLINIFRLITNIDNLEYDEYIHGAGLHVHPKYGRLNIHLDYEKHPYSGKERKINIILFMSKDWTTEYNGQNELWDKELSRCVKKTEVKFNRAIIFKTSDISWHGVPDKIMCPEDVFRKSIAYYYVSPLSSLNSIKEYRYKAKFVKRPQDVYDENLEKLYAIRPHRRITKEDLEQYMPNWDITL